MGFGFSGDHMGQIRYDIHKDSVPSLKLLEEFPKTTFTFGDKAQTSSLSHLDFLELALSLLHCEPVAMQNRSVFFLTS